VLWIVSTDEGMYCKGQPEWHRLKPRIILGSSFVLPPGLYPNHLIDPSFLLKQLLVCYAWRHSSVTYFVSTCGSTNPAKSSCVTHFEDEFGTIGVKHIPQPSIKEWFYDYLPLIDKHNNQW
jgi:hypothetical protein